MCAVDADAACFVDGCCCKDVTIGGYLVRQTKCIAVKHSMYSYTLRLQYSALTFCDESSNPGRELNPGPEGQKKFPELLNHRTVKGIVSRDFLRLQMISWIK